MDLKKTLDGWNFERIASCNWFHQPSTDGFYGQGGLADSDAQGGGGGAVGDGGGDRAGPAHTAGLDQVEPAFLPARVSRSLPAASRRLSGASRRANSG